MSKRLLIYTFFISFLCFVFINSPKFINFYGGDFWVYFLNVGQGDSALIKTESAQTILIDSGPDNSLLFRIGDILPFWVHKIDLVLVSHSHKDHLSGLIYLLEHYEIGCLYYKSIDPPANDEEVYLRTLINDLKIKLIFQDEAIWGCLKGNNEFQIQNFKNSFAYSNKYLKDQNNESLITLIKYRDIKVLFTGDAMIGEQELVARMVGSVSILKVPHQGSKYNLSIEALKILRPQYAVIPVGKNSYGHPHKEVVTAYYDLGVKLFRTDQLKYFSFNLDELADIITSNGYKK